MKIAILGLGTVGMGVLEIARTTPDIEVAKVLDTREFPELGDLVTSDYKKILTLSDIDVICECMGGIHPAYEYTVMALNRGKNVVTPNKALIGSYYGELNRIAAEHGARLVFTPAAGGGIPWLFNLARTTRCDDVDKVYGIVNGTCNFILDKMNMGKLQFDEVLKQAQDLGYAEADPTADIWGQDSAKKCILSANTAFNIDLAEETVLSRGIDKIEQSDIEFFRKKGHVCKLMMAAGRIDDKFYAYVEPTLVSADSYEAGVDSNNNLITLEADYVGKQSFFGQGAGRYPTAQSVIQDVIDIKDNVSFEHRKGKKKVTHVRADNSLPKHAYYLRISGGVENIPRESLSEGWSKDGNIFLITKKLSVSEAHDIAAKLEASGHRVFIAGFSDL